MPFLHSNVLDNGLNVLTNATAKEIRITSSEATDRATAVTATLGTKTAAAVGAPAARTPSGRRVTVAAVTDGTVGTTGTATHYALIDGTLLLAAGPLSASQAVTAGNTFTLAAFDIGIPGV